LSQLKRAITLAVLLSLFIGFCSLGTWQIQRRAWKLELIAQVDRQLAAEPISAPGPSQWPHIDEDAAYQRLQVTGVYQHQQETLVQALTSHGSGYWVITPLQTQAGFNVLVNRGFVDPEHREPDARPEGRSTAEIQLTGLLRLSEPEGRFLRPNEPQADRWFSRDVAAIAKQRGLQQQLLAPYFIDADANMGEWPIAGLTVVTFRNTHLVYAITWYGLALLTAFAAVILLRAGNKT